MLVVSTLGCTLLLDPNSRQCEVDDDCARLSLTTICRPTDGLCVPKLASVVGPDGKALDASVDAAGTDAGSKDATDDGTGTGDVPSQDPCDRPVKPIVTIEGDITGNFTLNCDKTYLLNGYVFVKSGARLTIAAGTTLIGDTTSKATLIVQPGGTLIASGTPMRPIVFTSARTPSSRAPGDWGGVILLGKAPVNVPNPTIEGITTGGEFGGIDENDSSGVLRYVRIEYAGVRIAPNNEINGLTFGGVGRGTVVDHIQVRRTADDCFEWFGGTVDAKYLVCQHNEDDGFDWDMGYRGRLQFLVLQQDPSFADETNGFEGDNNPAASTAEPRSEPVIFNATLCGKNVDVAEQQYGMLFKKATRGTIRNALVMGFEAGLDVRDPMTSVELTNSIFWGNVPEAIAYAEDGSNSTTQANDDEGFDERAFFNHPDRSNDVVDPGVAACFDARRPVFGPAKSLTSKAATPPEGFFDRTAAFIGAFRDANDTWATTGNWVVWMER